MLSTLTQFHFCHFSCWSYNGAYAMQCSSRTCRFDRETSAFRSELKSALSFSWFPTETMVPCHAMSAFSLAPLWDGLQRECQLFYHFSWQEGFKQAVKLLFIYSFLTKQGNKLDNSPLNMSVYFLFSIGWNYSRNGSFIWNVIGCEISERHSFKKGIFQKQDDMQKYKVISVPN